LQLALQTILALKSLART